MKPSVLIALVVGLVLGFVFGRVASGPGSATPTAAAPSAAAPAARPSNTTVLKVPVEGSPVAGSAEALVTLVEFSDYQCPFCTRAHGTVQQLQKDYGSKLRVVMKQNPLSFHPRARPAALAALAAGNQGKYWQYHDELFANQKALEDADLEKYAKEVGLDVTRWKRDMADPKLAEVINRDQALAQKLGASGTPAFFINGRFLSGAQPIDNFKAIINEELAKAEALVKAGTRPADVYAAVMAKAAEAPAAAPGAAPAAEPAVRKVSIPDYAPVKGAKAAKVTIVAWSDFECPFCGRVNPTLKQVEEAYGKDVRVVFRHQPLPFHQNAKLAAEASMAAHEQGKFWEYHYKLFLNQRALDRASLERYAQELKLDTAKFKAALDSGKFRSQVDQDVREGQAVGANGTPTFYINGRQLVGAVPFVSFKQIIDEEIGKADKLLASGTKLENVYEKLMAEGAAAAPAAAPAGAQAPAEEPVQKVEVGSAPVKGPKNAPVTIVAFSDFECPFCSRVNPTLKQIEDTYKGKVKVAFKHQPLSFHANAKPAAMAAMAAHEQGKFWEYHDKLFANQRALDRASLERYAQELGLNMPKFKAALDSNKYEAQVTADSQEGMRLGANGTPTFFINGRKLVGAVPFDSFKTIIDDELGKSGKVARDAK